MKSKTMRRGNKKFNEQWQTRHFCDNELCDRKFFFKSIYETPSNQLMTKFDNKEVIF